jgi:hypothetical protein
MRKSQHYLFWGLCEAWLIFFGDGPIKDAHHKRKEKKKIAKNSEKNKMHAMFKKFEWSSPAK